MAVIAIACALAASCASKTDFVTAMGLNELAESSAAARQAQTAENGEAVTDGSSSAVASPQALAFANRQQRPAALAAEETKPAQEQGGGDRTGEVASSDRGEVARPAVAAGSSAPEEEKPAAANRTLLGALFGSRTAQAEETPAAAPAESGKKGATEAKKPEVGESEDTDKPVQVAALSKPVDFSALGKPASPPVIEKKIILDSRSVSAAAYSADSLPGVRSSSELFDIVRKSGDSDDSDVDLYEDEGGYQVASAMGLARLAPHGLLKQRADVDTSCFKPQLVRLLKQIEAHYRKPVIVTSGYRSPEHNRRVRGARKSQHMHCAAADIQVQGVSRWELARFARSLPGRGGVGTYCHTASVHVDVGPERDWNWRCRR